MKAKYKMTGCARFLIFLVIMIPVAYFGSKYLRDSGTWDKIEDKFENRDRNSVDKAIEDRRDRAEIPTTSSMTDTELADQFERLRREYEEQELIIANQEKKIKDLREENAQLRKGDAAPTEASLPPPARTGTTTPSNSDVPSIDDLLEEADNSSGAPSDTRRNDSGSARTNLGSWSFTYGGTSGVITFYRKDGQLLSETAPKDGSAPRVDQLTRSGERFDVRNSPSGEYYVLRRDGDLDAFDRNGHQVTCRRR